MNQSDILKQTQRMELEIAERINQIYPAKRQAGSGNRPEHPNDVAVRNQFHVECKLTFANSIVLKLDWIVHALRQALQFGVPAILAIRFINPKPMSGTYFVIPASMMYHLLACQAEIDDLDAMQGKPVPEMSVGEWAAGYGIE